MWSKATQYSQVLFLTNVPTTLMSLVSVALPSIPDPGITRTALHVYSPPSVVFNDDTEYRRVLELGETELARDVPSGARSLSPSKGIRSSTVLDVHSNV